MHFVILSYNHPHLTERCVRSVLAVTSEEHVTLVHNGSTQAHRELLQKLFPAVDHLDLSTNRGFSGGANAGLQRGFQLAPWVVFLTNDCEWQGLATPIPSDTPASLRAGRLMVRRTNRVDSCGGIFDPKTLGLDHTKDFLSWQRSKQVWPYVPGTMFALHAEVWKSVGGFDESFGTYWEDVDFSVRAHHQGWPLIGDENLIALHGVGKTCHKDPSYTSYYYWRNQYRFCQKHALNLQRSRNSGPRWRLPWKWQWQSQQLRRLIKYFVKGDRIRLKLGLRAWRNQDLSAPS